MNAPSTYRKVWLFGMFALVDCALAALDKVSGDTALTALATAYTAAVGLNVWEHARRGRAASTTPERPAERQPEPDVMADAAEALRRIADTLPRRPTGGGR